MIHSKIGACKLCFDHYVLYDLFQADVIMSLAGSNGGSWSTTYSPKPTARQGSESFMTSNEYEGAVAANTPFPHEFRGRTFVTGNATHAVGSGDRISTPAGEYFQILLPTVLFTLS
jgi:hypothetical protein